MSTPNVKEQIQTLVEEFNQLAQDIEERAGRQREIKGAVEALNTLLEADTADAVRR